MKHVLLKLLALLAVLSLVAAACGGDDDDPVAASDDGAAEPEPASDDGAAEPECVLGQGVSDTEIKFGSSLPLTGNIAALGEQTEIALKASIARMNLDGGIHGRMVTLDVQDDGFESEKTVTNADYFINRVGVFGIWASVGSAPLVAALPIHNDADIMTLFPFAQDPAIYDREANPNFFILNPSAQAQAKSFSDYLGTEFDTGGEELKVAALSLNTPDGESAVIGFREGAAGPSETASQTWERDATTYQPQLIAMKDAGVTDVYTVVGGTQFAQIINEANQVGLEARFWGTNAVVSLDVVDLAGELAEGAYAFTQSASLSGTDPGIGQFKEEMRAAGADEGDLTTGAVLAFSGGLVLEEALELAGPCLNNDTLTEAMLGLTDFDTGGLMAPINFDPDTGLGNNGAIVQQIVDGAWTRVN